MFTYSSVDGSLQDKILRTEGQGACAAPDVIQGHARMYGSERFSAYTIRFSVPHFRSRPTRECATVTVLV